MGKCECGRLKGNPCGPLRPNTINVTMPIQVGPDAALGKTGFQVARDAFEHLTVLVVTPIHSDCLQSAQQQTMTR